MEFQLLLPFYYYSLIFLVLQSHLTCFSYAGQHLCAPDDASSLLQFKQGFKGEQEALTLSWNVTVDCCKWDGVTCDEFTGHVIGLYLTYSYLSGPIPESIGNLSRIRKLDLSFNNFTGNIPSTISKLNQLSCLDFSHNNFEGLIPDIFANFSELTRLDFSSNNFTGSFPYSIANLTRLTYLYLQNNSLTGPLPSSVSGLQKLFKLDLSSNILTGTAPPWLFLLPSLTGLDVSTNQLSGKLPTNQPINDKFFDSIDLSNNKLHGEIPDWMTSMNIWSLNLSHNFFTGFEKQIWQSKELFYLNLGNNFLQGSLHNSICDLFYLRVLDLAHNNFSGTIPGCLGNSGSLHFVDLRMKSSMEKYHDSPIEGYNILVYPAINWEDKSHDPWLTVQSWKLLIWEITR